MSGESWTSDAEAALGRMSNEWATVMSQLRANRRRAAAAQVAEWESIFAGMVQQQKNLQAAGEWISGPADLLSVIGRNRREMIHCAVLAWLMDPVAEHGLGDRFVRGVLQLAWPEVEWPEDAALGLTTTTEVKRDTSRADIVLDAPELLVVIEAKVDAGEQPRQCDRLFADWAADGARFVYLTPRGRAPRTATGDASGVFARVSLRSVQQLLARLVTATDTDSRGAAAVRTYLQTLTKEFA